MTSKKEQANLLNCLSWCSVRQLPEEWDKKNVYIKAIAKVIKSDGSISYVAIQKDKNGEDKYIKDFGNIAMIRQVLSIHPYLYLDAMYMPTFKGNSKNEKIAYLSAHDRTTDYSQMTAKELDKAILNVAIQKHLNAQ